MGALSRLRDYFLGWMKAKWQTYPAFADEFAKEIMSVAPGLTYGHTADNGLGIGIFVPANPGETDGEIYLSDDLVTPGVWMWQNGAWHVISGGGGSTISSTFPKYNEDAPDSGLYREVIGGAFPTQINWWASSAKVTKIQDLTISYDLSYNITQEVWRYYYLGILQRTVTDVITNSGPFEVSRSRTIS